MSRHRTAAVLHTKWSFDPELVARPLADKKLPCRVNEYMNVPGNSPSQLGQLIKRPKLDWLIKKTSLVLLDEVVLDSNFCPDHGDTLSYLCSSLTALTNQRSRCLSQNLESGKQYVRSLHRHVPTYQLSASGEQFTILRRLIKVVKKNTIINCISKSNIESHFSLRLTNEHQSTRGKQGIRRGRNL